MADDPTDPAAGVIGRDDALDGAARFVGAIATGPAGLLVEGEAGIGKTTVWRAAAAAAAWRDYRVLAATAAEGEADLPFVALRDLLEAVPAAAAEQLPAPQRDALAIALLRSDVPGAAADQHAVCVAVLGVVRALAAERPLVIAVDDVGWLDRSSDRVLRYVVRRLTTEQVGVLAARRPAVDPAAPLGLDSPAVGPRLGRVELGPLSADALHVLLTERHGLALRRSVTRRIGAACGGNPFAAVEIGRALHARGERMLDEEALPLPSGVLAATARRISALSPAAQRVLSVVAVAATATIGCVEAAAGEGAVDGVHEAAVEGLVEVSGSVVRFRHPLLRAAAAAALSARKRRRLHRELAAAVTDPDERAVHLAAGAIGPDESIAAALDAAARRAEARGAPDAASVLAARAAALTPADGGDAAARRRIRAGEYQYRAENPEAARAMLAELVGELPPGALRAEALLWLACARQAQNGMVEAVELARQALAEAGDDGLRAAAERHLALALVIVGDVAGGDRHAAAALVTARATADPTSIAESEAALAWTRFWAGGGLREELLDGARSRTTWSRYAPSEASPNVVAGLLLSWADHVDEARAVLRAEERRRTELGQDRPRAVVLFSLAELECRAGDWAAALHCAEDGLRTAELAGDEFYRSLLLYARGLVAAHQGRLDDARADAEAAVAIGAAVGSTVTLGFAGALLGFVALSSGDAAEADAQLGPLGAALRRDGRFDPGLARYVPDHVEALIELGHLARAEELLAPFAAQATALDRPWARGAAARCRALLHAAAGEPDAALTAVDTALTAHDGSGPPFERARTLLAAGSVRRRARRLREARATLDDAIAEFTRLGAVAWTGKARAELGRIGGRTPSPTELTEAERRIAEQVAAGLSNKEVAAALFLTVGSVESALWKIYRKLGVRTRTQLAARLDGD